MRNSRVKSPRVALLVDHPRRDLAGLVLTAYELCQEGVTCHLVPFNLQRKEIWALAPDFVVLNYLRRGANESLGRELVRSGIRFGVLDTEGGVWPTLKDYTEILWEDAALLRKASRVCAWGPELADHTVQQGIFVKEQIEVTGCPRFDLYHPDWRALTESNGGSTRDGAKSRILVNTNFSDANPRFKTHERQRQLMEALGWEPSQVSDLLAAEHVAIRSIIDLIQRLSADYPDTEIVLRPHPFEDPDLYRKELGGLRNVQVNGEGTVQSQILHTDVVIQQGCTTGIEATLAGVPTVSPYWFPTPLPMPMVDQVSIPAPSYADMRMTLDAIFAGQYRPSEQFREARESVLRRWFHRPDGLSHKRAADALRGCLTGPRDVDERLCARLLHGIYNSGVGPLVRLGGRVRYALGLSPDWSFSRMREVLPTKWSRGDKFFDAGEVRKLVDTVDRTVRSRGRGVKPVHVFSARAHGDYQSGYQGFAVTMRTEGPAERDARSPEY